MPNYRRAFIHGGTYFFTVVTEHRADLFHQERARRLLGDVMRRCLVRYPHDVLAMVLLPDHLHTLWTLPEGDHRYSERWRWIKREFTREWSPSADQDQDRSASRMQQRRRSIWQRRFWEHVIQDEADLEAHFDYIHYNPVKHGYVERPCDWPWSSFHQWVRRGHYSIDWAAKVHRDLPGDAGE